MSAWHPLHLLATVSHGSQLVTARCSVLVGLQLIPPGEHPPSFLPRAAPGRELIGLILFGSRLQTKATRIFLETDFARISTGRLGPKSRRCEVKWALSEPLTFTSDATAVFIWPVCLPDVLRRLSDGIDCVRRHWTSAPRRCRTPSPRKNRRTSAGLSGSAEVQRLRERGISHFSPAEWISIIEFSRAAG